MGRRNAKTTPPTISPSQDVNGRNLPRARRLHNVLDCRVIGDADMLLLHLFSQVSRCLPKRKIVVPLPPCLPDMGDEPARAPPAFHLKFATDARGAWEWVVAAAVGSGRNK